MAVDIVTVVHNDANFALAKRLHQSLEQNEQDGTYSFYIYSNQSENLGFARGCNMGAFRPDAISEIIGFINPDAVIQGSFLATVEETLASDDVVITGCRWGKPDKELREWGVRDWVCGAAFFVKRDWFASLDGFDERFIWSFEETDFIRRTERAGKRVLSVDLPINHASPMSDSYIDLEYKTRHIKRSSELYYSKWGR